MDLSHLRLDQTLTTQSIHHFPNQHPESLIPFLHALPPSASPHPPTYPLVPYRSGVIVGVIKVEVDIVNAESKWYGLWLWKGEEDNNKEGKQEQEKEERAEWYGLWPSEKEDSGV